MNTEPQLLHCACHGSVEHGISVGLTEWETPALAVMNCGYEGQVP